MKNKSAKYTDMPDTVNFNPLQLQSPLTRNKIRNIQENSVGSQPSPVSAQPSCERTKIRSIQVNSVGSQSAPVSTQPSCERNKMRNIQEDSIGSKAPPVPSHTTYERNKIRNIQENSITSKASPVQSQVTFDSNKIQTSQENNVVTKVSPLPSQSTYDSCITSGQNEQQMAITKVAPKVMCSNGQNTRYEEQNVIGNIAQNARGQNKTSASVKSDVCPASFLKKTKEKIERHSTYTSTRNETDNFKAFQDVTPKLSPVMRYADQRESQNRIAEQKIADIRKGFNQKQRLEFETVDSIPKALHQSVKNGTEIEYQIKTKGMLMDIPNYESTCQEQLQSTLNRESDNFIQVDRQVREGSSNIDSRPTPAREVEQIPHLDLLSRKMNGFGPTAAHVTTVTGNSLTIKSGSKEVVLVFMNSSQSVNGRGGQTAEAEHCSGFQEREIPATSKSITVPATATDTTHQQMLHSGKPEIPLQSAYPILISEANATNQNISCEKGSSIKIRDLSAGQANDDSNRHSFQKVQRPLPIIPQTNRTHLSAAATEPQSCMAVGASDDLDEESAFLPDENALDCKRNLIPVREASTQAFPRNVVGTDVYTGNNSYRNTGPQMQLPSSAYRGDTDETERPWFYDQPSYYHYGQEELCSHEDPTSEAQFQQQMPIGHHSMYGRLPVYGQHTLPNKYRDQFHDVVPEQTYPLPREHIGVLRCRRLSPSCGGRYAYPFPIRNAGRVHRTSILDRRPHIYRRRVYPEQPFYGCVDDGNLFFLNTY